MVRLLLRPRRRRGRRRSSTRPPSRWAFIAVDNDWGWGEFSDLLRLATTGNAGIDPDQTDTWWRGHGAERVTVQAGWHASSSDELEAILRVEFADAVADEFLTGRQPSNRLSYGTALFIIHR